ncbi:MAG TPA: methyltransferase domain-containing protein [Polyangia bacterium]|nr:methyltransferase domain-containing protein [Polyangia bacterium]
MPGDEDRSYLTPTPPAGIPVSTERASGGIAIEGGDFATPAPDRKRRITQPRGMPVVEVPPAEEPVAASSAVANGVAASDSSLGIEEPTPGPEEITLSLPTDPQVPRLLFGAPPTPPPDFLSTPTPPPLTRSAQAPEAQLVAPSPPPLERAPMPSAQTPTPSPRTPSPQTSSLLVAALPRTPTPAPVRLTPAGLLAGAPPVVDAAAAEAGAIPARPLPDVDSGGNITPLASTLAHMAEAARSADAGGAPDGDVSADDEVELMDASIGQSHTEAARKPVPPPPPVSATPPPLPSAARPRTPAELLSALPVPEALSPRPRRPKRSKPWFEEVFDEDYTRTLPFVSVDQTAKEATFIERSLETAPGGELLDVACGYGRHAVELCHRGYKVTGLDLSLPLLIRAADEAQRRAVSVNFVHTDMREMAFERQFDGAYCMLTSFGYFDEDANLKVAEGIARSLKPGARFLLDVVNRDYVVGDLPTRIWWEGIGCVVLEEVDFNFHTSRITSRRSVVFDDGRQLEQEISIRAYGLHELGRLLRQAGFRVLDISGSFATRSQFFGSASRNLLILAEKRVDEH